MGRPRTIIDLKTGIKNDGRITAVKARVVQDGGAYCSYGERRILLDWQMLNRMAMRFGSCLSGFKMARPEKHAGNLRGMFP